MSKMDDAQQDLAKKNIWPKNQAREQVLIKFVESVAINGWAATDGWSQRCPGTSTIVADSCNL